MNRPTQFHEQFDREETLSGSSDRTFCLAFVAVFGLLAFAELRHGHPLIAACGFAGAGAMAIIAILNPRLLAPLNRMWMSLGVAMARLTTPVFLGVIYFAVMLPIGLCMRAQGKDLLRMKRDKAAQTYWIAREGELTPESMINQF